MAGIQAMGTTFNLPNYPGELFQVTPQETPFLSAIGGLSGGGRVSSVQFTWGTEDLRDPSQNTKVEGANAPTAEARVRGTAGNVLEIHQERVTTSYTKQATVGMLTSPSAAPFVVNAGDTNPVQNEHDHQVQLALATIALDVNWSFINGKYANPTTNATPRKTRGLLEAISTNVVDLSDYTSAALSAATDTITEAATPRVNGDVIIFSDTGASTTLVAGRKYWVRDKAAGSFKVSASNGGAAVTIGTATVTYRLPEASTALTVDNINALSQLAYDNGGLSNQATATLLVNSTVKLAISKAYATAWGQAVAVSGNVGGVVTDTILTDFGRFNVILDRHVPQDTAIIVSMEECSPVFLEVPGKGVFFEEPLAKTGASEDSQLYGEIGLNYGNERKHAVLRGIKII